MNGRDNIMVILSSPSGVGNHHNKKFNKYHSFKISVSTQLDHQDPMKLKVGLLFRFFKEFEKLIDENEFMNMRKY